MIAAMMTAEVVFMVISCDALNGPKSGPELMAGT